MDKHTITELFNVLASGIRLEVWRVLVRHPAVGMVAGDIAKTLNLPPANLSFHLKAMSQAGLLHATQEGRYIRYHANVARMYDTIAYLTAACPPLASASAPTTTAHPDPATGCCAAAQSYFQ